MKELAVKASRSWLVVLGLALSLPSRAHAQADRHELGLRLRAMEAAWSKPADDKARQRALPHIQRAVAGFFGFNLGEAGKWLDQARFQLQAAEPPPAAVRWAESLQLQVDCRFVDAADTALGIHLSAFYPVEGDIPARAKLRLTLCNSAGKVLTPALEAPIKALPLKDKLSLDGVVEGDLQLRLEMFADDKQLCGQVQGVSCATRRDGRLADLKKGQEGLPKDAPRSGQESLRGLLKILEALANRQTLETNYPAARLLSEAEALRQALADGKEYWQKRPGEFWLTLPTGKGTTPVRLLAPEAVQRGEPLPLVVALHGAGGSENMFFDGYGRGAIVELCRKRGWLLVAPRCPLLAGQVPVAELIEEIAKLYPVDRKRVFLVGHSLGAAQAIGAVNLSPECYAGIAALGGGGAPKPSAGLKKVPFFVGVGNEDFALGGSRSLRERLGKAGVEKVRLQEYPGIEHLTIVQTALPEVFGWFDQLLK